MEKRYMENICVIITYKTGRYVPIHENKETVISCSIEQAIHDLAVRFLHNNPGMKIEIVKAESV
jgi:hypothetical protein